MLMRIARLLPATLLVSLPSFAGEPPVIVSGARAAEELAVKLEQPGFGPWYERLSGGLRQRIRSIARSQTGESLSTGDDQTFFGLRGQGGEVEITTRKGGGTSATLTAGGGLSLIHTSPGGSTTLETFSPLRPYAFAKAKPLRVLGRPAALVWEHLVSPNDSRGNFSRTRLYVGSRAEWSVRVPLGLGRRILGRGR
jgi:hypothetical protein